LRAADSSAAAQAPDSSNAAQAGPHPCRVDRRCRMHVRETLPPRWQLVLSAKVARRRLSAAYCCKSSSLSTRQQCTIRCNQAADGCCAGDHAKTHVNRHSTLQNPCADCCPVCICWLWACVCRLHGTRDAVTAALHIALGDCTALDVGRMAALPPPNSSQQQAPGTPAGAATGAVGPPQLQQAAPNKGPVGAWDWGLSVGSQSELLPGGADVSACQALFGAAAPAPATQQPSSSAGPSSAQSRRSDKRKQQQHKRQQQAAAAAAASAPHQQQQQQQDVSMYVPHLQPFVCVANYGFLGDVLETSERLRWCGPMR
jgi:hypothetical protein